MPFDWDVQGSAEVVLKLGSLEPCDVLYDFDGPHVFVFEAAGHTFLANLLDRAEDRSRFLIAPTSPMIVSDLRSGRRSLLEALDQPWTWVAEVDGRLKTLDLWRVLLRDLPGETLPEPGLMLFAHLEPLISARLVGRDLRRDAVPASVIKRAVDGVYKALKTLVQAISQDNGGRGRPADGLRQSYDLPVQRMAFGSFEIAFVEPRPIEPELPFTNPPFVEIGGRLDVALSWVEDDADKEQPGLDLLESLESLVPPQHGLVEEVHLHGRLFARPYLLDRGATARLRTALTESRRSQERILTVVGSARELDKDRMSFRLHHQDGLDYVCVFQEEAYDDVMDIFRTDAIVNVTLKIRRGSTRGEVLAVTRGQRDDDALSPP